MTVKKQAGKEETLLSPGGVTQSILEELANAAEKSKIFPNGIDHLELEVSIAATKGFTLGVKALGPTLPPKEQHGLRAFAPTAHAFAALDLRSLEAALQYASAMEAIAPPLATVDPGDPTPGAIAPAGGVPLAAPTLKSVADFWADSCVGGDQYTNNCAHFLSDAFIRAGFTELRPPASCIQARCSTSAARPIRARDMWCWFQSKATNTSTTLTPHTGWWATFQLDESAYWGGHVALFDSDNWKYYGTGWYPNWDQHLYQW